MKPLLVVGLALFTLVSIALAGPGGVDEADASRPGERESAGEGRLHVLLTETETGVRVSPARPDAKPKKGQYRVSCESFTFDWRGDRPVLVFRHVVMESEQGRIAGTKAILHLSPPGWMRVEGTVFIKPLEGGPQQWPERQKESIERGMKASELEHRQRWGKVIDRGTKASAPERRLPRIWTELLEKPEKRDR